MILIEFLGNSTDGLTRAQSPGERSRAQPRRPCTPGFARRRRGRLGSARRRGSGSIGAGGLASLGAGDWLRSARAIGSLSAGDWLRSAPSRARGADLPERSSALLARPGSSERPGPTSTRIQASAGTFMGWGDPSEGHDCSLGAARGPGLASLGAEDWLRSAPRIGFARRGKLASVGAGDWLRSAPWPWAAAPRRPGPSETPESGGIPYDRFLCMHLSFPTDSGRSNQPA